MIACVKSDQVQHETVLMMLPCTIGTVIKKLTAFHSLIPQRGLFHIDW